MDIGQDRGSFRCSEADLEKLGELLKHLEGTHNFHNYTVGREFRDRAAQRYMIKLEVSVFIRLRASICVLIFCGDCGAVIG